MTILNVVRRACALAVAALLVGCASQKPIGLSPQVEAVEAMAMPAPTKDDISLPDRAYYIGPLDKLRIEVFGVEGLSRDIQVDSAGSISFPLSGTINASGRQPDELAAALEARLATYIRNPSVSVNVIDFVGRTITVDGKVTEPGIYPVAGRFTLIRAVARAGGTTASAGLDDVVILRTVSGQKYAALYNLGAIRRGNYEDPEIFSDDIIIVGDSPQRRLFDDLLAFSPVLVSPLIILLQGL